MPVFSVGKLGKGTSVAVATWMDEKSFGIDDGKCLALRASRVRCACQCNNTNRKSDCSFHRVVPRIG